MSHTIARAREDRAIRALLTAIGVTPEEFEQGGPDGQELTDLVYADIETWNGFGQVAQDWKVTDEVAHARLVAGWAVGPNDPTGDPDFGWTLYPIVPLTTRAAEMNDPDQDDPVQDYHGPDWLDL